MITHSVATNNYDGLGATTSHLTQPTALDESTEHMRIAQLTASLNTQIVSRMYDLLASFSERRHTLDVSTCAWLDYMQVKYAEFVGMCVLKADTSAVLAQCNHLLHSIDPAAGGNVELLQNYGRLVLGGSPLIPHPHTFQRIDAEVARESMQFLYASVTVGATYTFISDQGTTALNTTELDCALNKICMLLWHLACFQKQYQKKCAAKLAEDAACNPQLYAQQQQQQAQEQEQEEDPLSTPFNAVMFIKHIALVPEEHLQGLMNMMSRCAPAIIDAICSGDKLALLKVVLSIGEEDAGQDVADADFGFLVQQDGLDGTQGEVQPAAHYSMF